MHWYFSLNLTQSSISNDSLGLGIFLQANHLTQERNRVIIRCN